MTNNYLEPIQTTKVAPSKYEAKLAAVLEEILGRGTHDLPGLLAELNDAGIASHAGEWTEASLIDELGRLGASA